MPSLGVVCNFFNEAHALPGWLECASQLFDEIVAYQAGPNGEESDDGSIDILKRWKIPIHRGSINEGFGVTRTAAIRATKTEWTAILDCDERIFPFLCELRCSGESTPPDVVNQILQEYDTREPGACPSNWENLAKLGADLRVSQGNAYPHGAWLKSLLEDPALDAIGTVRRHWHDFSWKRPTQNWHTDPDRQIRIVRNIGSIYFDPSRKMHETLLGVRNPYVPNQTHGPFFDHFHLFWKAHNPHQRAFAIRVYDAVHHGTPVPSWREFKKERGL